MVSFKHEPLTKINTDFCDDWKDKNAFKLKVDKQAVGLTGDSGVIVTKLVEVEKEWDLDLPMAGIVLAITGTLRRVMKVHAHFGLIGLTGTIVLQPVMMEFKHELVNVKMGK